MPNKIILILFLLSLSGCAANPPLGAGEKDEISKTKLIEKYNLAPEIKAKYSLKDSSLVKTDIKNPELDAYKGEPKDEIKVTIGDSLTELTPAITLTRWNEVDFKLKPKGLDLVASKDKILTFENDKIKFTTPKISFEMFDFAEGEGGYKYIWYLNEPPVTNKIEFEIQSSGLDFFYQAELTPEEIALGMERPENVVGSYVVYHSSKGKLNDSKGKDYKAGQAFFIYRPHIIDAIGAETWGILHIENGIYSVEIPQTFLDSAVYPVKSNDSFGYTTLGATTLSNIASKTSTASRTFGEVFVLSTAGTLDSIVSGHRLDAGSEDSVDVSDIIYREDSGGSGSHGLVVLIERLNIDFDTTPTWYTFTAASEPLTADTYVLAALGDGEDITAGDSANLRFVGNSTPSSAHNRYDENTTGAGSYATRKAEDPWTETAADDVDFTVSIYANYTATGGEAVPVVNKPSILIIE